MPFWKVSLARLRKISASTRAKTGVLFPELLARVAEAAPDMRIRFVSPHPKARAVLGRHA